MGGTPCNSEMNFSKTKEILTLEDRGEPCKLRQGLLVRPSRLRDSASA